MDAASRKSAGTLVDTQDTVISSTDDGSEKIVRMAGHATTAHHKVETDTATSSQAATGASVRRAVTIAGGSIADESEKIARVADVARAIVGIRDG
jgi:hypothetical protein